MRNILVVGAGYGGKHIIKELNRLTNSELKIIGIIDDDKEKLGLKILGIEVIGDRYCIPMIIKEEQINEIIIAIPSANSYKIKEIYKLCNAPGVKVKILPEFNEILLDRPFVKQARDVSVEDLLGRNPIVINNDNIKEIVKGKKVLITGGAGSIGSELSRQIAKFSPQLIINLDVNENNLYFLELELIRNHKGINLKSEVANIRERDKLEYLFQKYTPDIVFHAAAHKHVPLMENNPEEAIKNNVFGTRNIAELSDKYNVERFVLISTDKAVNPTNVMGATKRLAEIIIQNLNIKSNTKYMAVRFGNVLGSNGSVIPLFKRLLQEGRNLTVTHPEVTRYFMTIPEASQLVIEAGTLGQGGEVFVLDMGEPIKIIDLARKMIELSGLNLDEDIDIDIIGLRPGEKLYEELLYDVNSAIKTDNQKIFIAKLKEEKVNIEEGLKELSNIIKSNNKKKIKEKLKDLVKSYKEPEHHNEKVS
ncbi:nucleoside-diphosphate sugar epimerase [Orenia metallireducens]|uniref:Nucleoside-diphosphate sugar epimerase n=2 Tax=Orenia metallireducens TaxID=1413210 RepID=A0A1C0A607_9FIRM|nr:nucleoside-diphosphate sugar epimerase/dehydratase [Orenia metallireducens]OCL25574.1 nucleoside-diphosphate sugar epimerase [Orenia metallireducens]